MAGFLLGTEIGSLMSPLIVQFRTQLGYSLNLQRRFRKHVISKLYFENGNKLL